MAVESLDEIRRCAELLTNMKRDYLLFSDHYHKFIIDLRDKINMLENEIHQDEDTKEKYRVLWENIKLRQGDRPVKMYCNNVVTKENNE